MRLSENFTLQEFIDASHVDTLNATQIYNAQRIAREILQPARNALGPIRLSRGGFVRTSNVGGGTHAFDRAVAVDVVPVKATVGELFHWLAANNRHAFGRLIYERDHIHVTLPGAGSGQGRGLVYVEPVEGEYHLIRGIGWLAAFGLAGAAILIRSGKL